MDASIKIILNFHKARLLHQAAIPHQPKDYLHCESKIPYEKWYYLSFFLFFLRLHQTLKRRLKRRKKRRSFAKIIKPKGIIQNPKMGKNHNKPPKISNTPTIMRPTRELGKLNSQRPSFIFSRSLGGFSSSILK